MRRFAYERRILATTAALACLVGSIPIASGDGRIPIYQPTVIGADGNYYLTRDITTSGVVIDVLPAAINVNIDLNGHTLTRTDPGEVIRADAGGNTVERSFEFYDGDIFGFAYGDTAVRARGWGNANLHAFRSNGDLELLESDAVAIWETTAASVTVTGTASDHVTGTISRSSFVDSDGHGLEIVDGSALQIENVAVENPAGHGVRVSNCDACQFRDISVQDAGGSAVRVEDTRASCWSYVTAVNSQESGIYVDTFSQGNRFIDVTASSAQNANPGFLNNGSQTTLNRGHFQGNSGGGILNNGTHFVIRYSSALGNASPNFQDAGILTHLGADNTWD